LSSQFHLPSLSKTNKGILIAMAAFFILSHLLPLKSYLALDPDSIFSGQIHRLFTFFLIPNDIMSLLFGGMAIWFIGSDLEQRWGPKRYLIFLFVVSVAAAIIYVGICGVFKSGGPVLGLHGIVSALCVAYGLIYPERTMYFFIFPLKAKYFVAIIIALSIYSSLAAGYGGAWFQLLTLGVAGVWLYILKEVRLPNMPKKSAAPRRKKKSSHLKLVDDDKDDVTYH